MQTSQPQPNSTEENEITLGVGMGPLKFGASQDEVRALMGEPEEIEESEDDDEFEHQAGLRIFGEAIHGKSVQEIQDLMSRHGLQSSEMEKMEEGAVRLSYEKEMIDLYFDEDQLQFVNFGVFINDDLEVQWPA
jgi:hypothetical protein